MRQYFAGRWYGDVTIMIFFYVSFVFFLHIVQPCACLGLIRGFVTVNCSGVGSLVPPPNPNLKDQGLPFVWPLPFDLSGICGLPRAYALTSIALRVIGAGKLLHDKAVVLEKTVFICKVIKFINYCVVPARIRTSYLHIEVKREQYSSDFLRGHLNVPEWVHNFKIDLR